MVSDVILLTESEMVVAEAERVSFSRPSAEFAVKHFHVQKTKIPFKEKIEVVLEKKL